MIRKIIDRILLVIWFLLIIIFIISLFTKLEIKYNTIRNIGFIALITEVILLVLKLLKIKISSSIKTFVVFISTIFLGILINYFEWTGSWKTQTIIYKHGHLNFKTIEFQMQDKGALGYNRRIVEVTNLFYFARIIEPVDTSKVDLPWIRIDKDVNELKLKP